MNEDVSPKKNADFPASYVSELRGVSYPTVVEDWASIRRYTLKYSPPDQLGIVPSTPTWFQLPTRIIPYKPLLPTWGNSHPKSQDGMVNMLAKWLELDPGYVECCLDPMCPMFVFSHPNCFQNMVKSE